MRLLFNLLYVVILKVIPFNVSDGMMVSLYSSGIRKPRI